MKAKPKLIIHTGIALTTVLFSAVSTQPLVCNGQGAVVFTYQGRLNNGGSPANGNYVFRFTLYDSPQNSNIVGSPITTSAVSVSNGLFTVPLGFGTQIFDGADRWLGIEVHPDDNVSQFAALLPLQRLTPAPYAMFALSAGIATVANGVSSSTVIQGQSLVVGYSNSLSGAYATIAGGGSNTVNGSYVALVGGLRNAANSNLSAIVGGSDNLAVGDHAVVVGGERNSAQGHHAFVGGGANNSAKGYDVVCGGVSNQIGADASGILSGIGNHVTGYGSWIGGGLANQLDADFSGIGGGTNNFIQSGSTLAAVISGGALNAIMDGSPFSSVGGGIHNLVNSNSPCSTVGGGTYNRISREAPYSTIGGGNYNFVRLASINSTISGGEHNTISSNSPNSTISGGVNNIVHTNVSLATIPGGRDAAAGSFGQLVYASGSFLPNSINHGDAQTSVFVLRGTTTNTAKTELYLDGNGSLSQSNRMVVPRGGAWAFDILVIGMRSDGLQLAGYQIKGIVLHSYPLDLTALVGTPSVTTLDGSAPSWSTLVEASNNALQVKAIGGASSTIRWVASVRTVEVGFLDADSE